MFGNTLSRCNFAHMECRTYNMWTFFLSDSSIIRQMLEKWDVEQMGKRATDMDPILIPAYEETFSF